MKNSGIDKNSQNNSTHVPFREKLKRNVGLQTYIYHKEYVKPSVAVTHNLETLEYSKLWAVPHSVSYIIVLSVLLFTCGDMSSGELEGTAKKGIYAVIGCLVTFGCIYLPDSVLKRPHPVFWRFFQSLGILYLLFLVFILFQTLESTRKIMNFFDSDLGQPLLEKEYAAQCGLTKTDFPFVNFENILISVDFYMLIHFVGWVYKMIFVRDVYMCWFLSVTWELIELSLRHWINNFYECWWDSLILDIFLCNGLGIYIGSKICSYFESRDYKDWISEKYKMTKVRYYLKYLLPNTWVKHEWNTFSSFKGYISSLWLMAVLHLVDLSNFMLKWVIWIPPSHNLLLVRIFIWAGLAAMSIREYYEYVTSKTVRKFGQYVWLAHMILFTEYAIIFKFSKNMYEDIAPAWVKLFWVGFVFLNITFAIWLILRDLKISRVSEAEKKVESFPNGYELPMDIEYVDESTQCGDN